MRINYIIIASILFLLLSFVFKIVSENSYIEIQEKIRVKKEKISKIKELKSEWNSKKIEKKLKSITRYIPLNSRKKLEIKNRKLTLLLFDLKPSIYNRVIRDIWNTKVKIIKFKSGIVNEKYEVEIRCSW